MAINDYYAHNATNQFTVASTAQLPNVSGATIQTSALNVGDVAFVSGTAYYCYDATLTAAIWSTKSFRNPMGIERIQTVNAATATILGDIDRVIVTYAAGGCTLTLPTVLAGAPIGTRIIVQKANTSANGITITPDSGASINAAAADATQAMVGLNATASTTVSAAATNDIAAVFIRTGALTWRSSAL